MELCELLPWWEAWLGPGLGALFGVGTTVAVLELLRARSVRKLARAASAHWSERALVQLESKIGILSSGIWGTILAVFLITSCKSGSGCSPENLALAGFGLVILFCTFRAVGSVDTAYRGSAHSVGTRLRGFAAFLVVFYPVLLIVVLASVTSAWLAPRDGIIWVWVGAVAVIQVVSSTGIFYGLARPLGLAWPARESVRRAVERAQGDAPTAVRQVDELAWLMPNAVALPLQGIVAFTKPAADQMTDEELHAIALHELGHLREPPFVRWMRPVRAGLLFLPVSVMVPLLMTGRHLGFAVLTGSIFVAAFATRGFSKRHEAKADEHAHAHSPAYARALETLHRLAGIPAVISKHATHPSLYDRMLEAGIAPDFPRPRAPNQLRPLLFLLPLPFLMVGFLVAALFLKTALTGDEERSALLGVAISGTPRDLLALARTTSDERLAELLYERALEEDPSLDPEP
jgi:Zn-dependent protease with chaperone function